MTTPSLTGPRLSVVIPLYNERDNVPPLIAAIRLALADQGGHPNVAHVARDGVGPEERDRRLSNRQPAGGLRTNHQSTNWLNI